ncbi:MAG TPA: hypothetical protein PKK06_13565 [Phycisphaerae bacterium]|nr:hypothetical protein [Phycisphaerae bacterium]HNU46113.1 hypothetical protein [Phycisphaerae bacterium]
MMDEPAKVMTARRDRGGRAGRVVAWLVAGALALVGGCQGSRLKEAQAVRNERIARNYAACVEREARRRETAQTALEEARRSEARHRQQLKATEKQLHDRRIRKIEDWQENAPQRRATYRSGLRGHPEDIPDTFADMIY